MHFSRRIVIIAWGVPPSLEEFEAEGKHQYNTLEGWCKGKFAEIEDRMKGFSTQQEETKTQIKQVREAQAETKTKLGAQEAKGDAQHLAVMEALGNLTAQFTAKNVTATRVAKRPAEDQPGGKENIPLMEMEVNGAGGS